MSQFPFRPMLDPVEDTLNMPVEDYSNNMMIINEALDKVKGTSNTVNNYPEYFDDLLSELIDAIPLE